MKVTDVQVQLRNPDRLNVSIDGTYRFSLDISQIIDLNVKIGRELSENEIEELEQESLFGKLYARTLEYCLQRPHSVREVRDYLYRKTLTTKYKTKQGEIKQKEGYSPALTDRVLERLQRKSYVDDEKFARWWVENRNLTKGTSLRKLRAELQAKGVEVTVIDEALAGVERSDETELTKVIAKKRSRYPDEQKLIQYLARQGFSYDDIKQALGSLSNEE